MWLTTVEQVLELLLRVFPGETGIFHALHITNDACYVDGKCVARQQDVEVFPGTISDVEVGHLPMAEIDEEVSSAKSSEEETV